MSDDDGARPIEEASNRCEGHRTRVAFRRLAPDHQQPTAIQPAMFSTAPPTDGRATGWQDLAACRQVDPALFFPNGSTGAAVDQIRRACSICELCEVRSQCLEYALEWNLQAGVWGGVPEEERKRLRRGWLADRRRR